MTLAADFLQGSGLDWWGEPADPATGECAGARACSLRQAPVDEWGEIDPNANTCTLVATCGMREQALAGTAQWQTVRVVRPAKPAAVPEMTAAESAMWDQLKADHKRDMARRRTARLARAGLPADTPYGRAVREPVPRLNPYRDAPEFAHPTPLGVKIAVDELCARAAEDAKWVAGIRRVVARAADATDGMARVAMLEDEFGATLDWVIEDEAICTRADELAATLARRVNLIYAAHGVRLADADAARKRQEAHDAYTRAAQAMRPRDLADWARSSRARAMTPAEAAADAATLAQAWDALQEAVSLVAHTCQLHHVPAPQLTRGVLPFEAVRGAIARAGDPKWWRKKLRTAAKRIVEAGSIKLGAVNRRAGGYCSDHTLKAYQAQKRRSAASLANRFIVNEAGQIFSLAEAAASSVSNPVNRGGELMTRIRGCEEFADAAGHVGLFITLTCPSAMHRMLAKEWRDRGAKGAAARAYDDAAGAYEAVPNPNWDRVSTPRHAQDWLCKQWGKARAALARKKVRYYGFRVAEPHHDGTPHWHMLLWCESREDANKLQALLYDYWVCKDGDYAAEKGAAKFRTNFKRMEKGGAAGYIAKYIAKSIGHHALAEHWDTAGDTGDLFTVDMGSAHGQGHERVAAWASSWGIRQFQPLGQPSVGLWREMRRVTPDQVQNLGRADAPAQLAWRACQKLGDKPADYAAFLHAVGGVCLRRDQYQLQLAIDKTPRRNAYGEHAPRRCVRGVVAPSGKWLVSRRQLWRALDGEESRQAKERAARGETPQDEAERASRGAPWTGFNNYTSPRISAAAGLPANPLWAPSEALAKGLKQAEDDAWMTAFLGASDEDTAQAALLHARAAEMPLPAALCWTRWLAGQLYHLHTHAADRIEAALGTAPRRYAELPRIAVAAAPPNTLTADEAEAVLREHRASLAKAQAEKAAQLAHAGDIDAAMEAMAASLGY